MVIIIAQFLVFEYYEQWMCKTIFEPVTNF